MAMAQEKYSHSDMELPRPAAGKKGGAWELDGLNITLAENGYSVNCSYKREPDGTKDMGSTYKSETKVFESARSLIEFLEETLEG